MIKQKVEGNGRDPPRWGVAFPCVGAPCRYNDDAFDRVIYSESHDEGGKRQGAGAAKRSARTTPRAGTLGTFDAGRRHGLYSSGIPMLFQGQEFLEGDGSAIRSPSTGIKRGVPRYRWLYRDLIRLRLTATASRAASAGIHTGLSLHEERNVIAFHRWDQGGPRWTTLWSSQTFSTSRRRATSRLSGRRGPGSSASTAYWQGYSDDFIVIRVPT